MRHYVLDDVLTIILAGGVGSRLYPLTKDRAKPSVPFGGMYRIIDFTLSNCLNSHLRRVYVLTQYKSHSLNRHLKLAWSFLNHELGEFIEAIPPQHRVNQSWYQGTADAIFQNIYTLQHVRPKYVLVLSGDHVYSCDYRNIIDYHVERNADLTVAAIEIPVDEGKRFGIIQVDEDSRMIGFQEKPQNPKPIPNQPGKTLGSMGVYLFNTDVLVKAVSRDAKEQSDHDFGKNIIPSMMERDRVFVYPYRNRYWKDIGTLESYFEATMELVAPNPPFNLFDDHWPVRTYRPPYPPAKVFQGKDDSGKPLYTFASSLISSGCLIRNANVNESILGSDVRIGDGSDIDRSIIFDDVRIGKDCRIRKTIIDKHVRIPDGTSIGFNPDDDRKHFHVSPEGIVVVPRAMFIE